LQAESLRYNRRMPHDLIVIGAGPTGIAIGAEARKAGLDVLLIDRGPLTAAILEFPTYMTFFTTRDKLEIAGIPLSVPEEKPTRQQALLYYRAVAASYKLPLALHEEVQEAQRTSNGEFIVRSRFEREARERRAHAVALATGYFDHPLPFDLPGANLPWVHRYYRDPYRHFNEEVVLIGGGNSSCEAALDLWRNGARRVTMLVRDKELKGGVKYWVRPDVENRIAEGAIAAHFNTTTQAFLDHPRRVEVRNSAGQTAQIPADAVYVLIGFHPDAALERRCGIEVDPRTFIPAYNPETCESNVPGLYVAGTIQAGLDTGRIFIENSREHAPKIVAHLQKRLKP
jgi:thioredoxin reductase (NADPH)